MVRLRCSKYLGSTAPASTVLSRRPPSFPHRPRFDGSVSQLSRREKKSLFALFTAAFDVLLYRYTGQEDILLGVPIAERDRPGFQSMIGFLLHTHVLRTVVKGDLTFRELVGECNREPLNCMNIVQCRSIGSCVRCNRNGV